MNCNKKKRSFQFKIKSNQANFQFKDKLFKILMFKYLSN